MNELRVQGYGHRSEMTELKKSFMCYFNSTLEIRDKYEIIKNLEYLNENSVE